MQARSFHGPPLDGVTIHQGVNELGRILGGIKREVGVFCGGEDGVVTEDFLDLQQIDSRLN